MTYNTASGVPIPQGTDAFNPPAQFKDWGDKAGTYENRVVVALDSERTSLAPPTLREGLQCYVTGTKRTWRYEGGAWKTGMPHAEWNFARAAFPDGASSAFNTTANMGATNDTTFATVPATGNTITVADSGIYSLDVSASVPVAATGKFSITLVAGGGILGANFTPSGTNALSCAVSNVQLAAGASIALTIEKTTGGTADISATVRLTKLSTF